MIEVKKEGVLLARLTIEESLSSKQKITRHLTSRCKLIEVKPDHG